METSSIVTASTVSHCIPTRVLWLNRAALFVLFFWFGLLKIVATSPAEDLVTHLHALTLARWVPVGVFLTGLGAVECVIGLLWLVPRLTRYVLLLFLAQMAATFLPLGLLAQDSWQTLFVPTLTGQYIVKNVVLIASAFTIYSDCQMRGWRL